MNKKEKQTIKEVINSIEVHHSIIQNNLKHNARIGKETLKDMAQGMDISLSKLEYLIK